MISIETNAKSIELTGEEIHIHFTSGFPYFWLRNDGSGTVLMSLSPNISEGKDGVISVLAGSSAGTMHGFNDTRQDMYILGSGKVMVMATYTPENPFRTAAKGGGENGKAKPLILLKSTTTSCEFKNGLTGFELINELPSGTWAVWNNSNSILGDKSGNYVEILEKVGSLYGSSGIDSALFSTLDEFDLTNYNYILIDFFNLTNYSSNNLDNFGGSYFRLDEPEKFPQSNVAYDWSEWDTMSTANNYQGLFMKDISQIKGNHKLCFGVHHGTYSNSYSNALALLNIVLF